MGKAGRIIGVAAMSAVIAGCGVNEVPTKEEAAKARWADVESQYQRRADLIPNLVRTVQGAAAQERTVLREVTEARARATQVTVNPDQLTDPAAIQRFGAAQDALSQSLGRLLVTVEKYPELRSNENFIRLQDELAGTENRINVARRDYNIAVQDYNTTIRTFPAIVAANVIYGAKPMQAYKATTAGAEQAPNVDFSGLGTAPATNP